MPYEELKTVSRNIGMGVGFIAVYFILIAILILLHWKSVFSDAIAVTVIKCFTCITGINIAFYFGFRSVEVYIKHKETFMTPRDTHEHENNKLFSYQKQAKSEDEEKEPEPMITRIEQRMERASFSDHWYAVGSFTAAAGVALLVTWVGIGIYLSRSSTILFIFGVVLLMIGVFMIKGADHAGTDLKKYPLGLSRQKLFSENKYLCCAVWLYMIFIVFAIIVFILAYFSKI